MPGKMSWKGQDKNIYTPSWFNLIFFLSTASGMWDPSSLTTDRTYTPRIGRTES